MADWAAVASLAQHRKCKQMCLFGVSKRNASILFKVICFMLVFFFRFFLFRIRLLFLCITHTPRGPVSPLTCKEVVLFFRFFFFLFVYMWKFFCICVLHETGFSSRHDWCVCRIGFFCWSLCVGPGPRPHVIVLKAIVPFKVLHLPWRVPS